MTKSLTKSITVLMLVGLANCSTPIRQAKYVKPPLPELKKINLDDSKCRILSSKLVCDDVDMNPILQNDETLKNFIDTLLQSECFQ